MKDYIPVLMSSDSLPMDSMLLSGGILNLMKTTFDVSETSSDSPSWKRRATALPSQIGEN